MSDGCVDWWFVPYNDDCWKCCGVFDAWICCCMRRCAGLSMSTLESCEYWRLNPLPVRCNGWFSFSAALRARSSFGRLSDGSFSGCSDYEYAIIALNKKMTETLRIKYILTPPGRIKLSGSPVLLIHCPVFDSSSCFLRHSIHTQMTCELQQRNFISMPVQVSHLLRNLPSL